MRARSIAGHPQRGDYDLWNKTPVFSLAESVWGKATSICRPGQIALRFPMMAIRLELGPISMFPTSTNGVAARTIANFTALVGMYLSDVPDEYSGNFTVWPGSHRATAKYIQEHGPARFGRAFLKSICHNQCRSPARRAT
jgi:hypothetical protein